MAVELVARCSGSSPVYPIHWSASYTTELGVRTRMEVCSSSMREAFSCDITLTLSLPKYLRYDPPLGCLL